jgi:hypothetical protein
VWPFDRRCDVLRVGRDRVERWTSARRGLMLHSQQALSARPFEAAALQTAVTQLLHDGERTRAVDVVVESAWLPLLLIEPGSALLSRMEVEALLSHRVTTVFGAPGAGDAWELIVEHRAGDRQGLGFALASTVRIALLASLRAADCRVSSIQPAFTWGRAHFGSKVPGDGWWLWQERDRTLVALLRKRRVVALNAGAPLATSAEQAEGLVHIESLRQGLRGDAGPLTAAGWQAVPPVPAGDPASRLLWVSTNTSAAEGLSPGAPLGSAA